MQKDIRAAAGGRCMQATKVRQMRQWGSDVAHSDDNARQGAYPAIQWEDKTVALRQLPRQQRSRDTLWQDTSLCRCWRSPTKTRASE